MTGRHIAAEGSSSPFPPRVIKQSSHPLAGVQFGPQLRDHSTVTPTAPTVGFGGHLRFPLIRPPLDTSRPPITVAPRSIDELVSRVEAVEARIENGALYDEVQRLGVSPDYMRTYHATPRRVAMSEQCFFLPTLFAKLGDYGSPNALRGALATMQTIADRIEDLRGQRPQIGMLTSPDFQVTFKGPASGFFIRVPVWAHGQEEERVEGRQLFSGSERSAYNDVAFRDLTLAPGKIAEVQGDIERYRFELLREAKRVATARDRQVEFNEASKKAGRPIEDEMLRRVAQAEKRISLVDQRITAANEFLDDLLKSVDAVPVAETGRRSYLAVMSELNRRFAARLLGKDSFETIPSEHANQLLTFGIEHWPTFLQRFIAVGLLQPNEPFAFLRHDSEGTPPRYLPVTVTRITPREVQVQVRGRDPQPIDELVEMGREALAQGAPLMLVPRASIRYWMNYAVTPNVHLDDGMPYELLTRLQHALTDSGFVVGGPRGVTLFPYTELASFRPADPSRPYDGLKPTFDVLDYYALCRS